MGPDNIKFWKNTFNQRLASETKLTISALEKDKNIVSAGTGRLYILKASLSIMTSLMSIDSLLLVNNNALFDLIGPIWLEE